jgi:N6-L-threonylcarbamoyladenine synthase
MIILGIETSCDETAVAIVENGTKILSNIVASSQELHAETGGIIPEVAARQQIKSIIPVLQKAIVKVANNEDGVNKWVEKNIDAIAVTIGPGLIGSLLVGVETAKTLAFLWNKPIIPVNHLVGHLYANWLGGNKLPQFPAIGFVVSGGHTDLVVMKDHGKIKWIGGTRDDAAGEAFDKTARILNLPYPGGPSISKSAALFLEKYPKERLNMFPRPLINENCFDFSFSGLKTAVLNKAKCKIIKENSEQLAAEVQEAIVDVLVKKSLLAFEKYRPKSFLLAGGVAANKRLREKISLKIESFIPEAKLCTDNAAYIAACAFFNRKIKHWSEVNTNPSLSIEESV